MAATDFGFRQTEKVRKLLPEWSQGMWGVATDFIKKGEVETIGERDYRIPFKTVKAGRGGKIDLNMGDAGRGTASKGDKMISSYFGLRMNAELPMLATLLSNEVMLGNVFKDTMKELMPNFKNFMDKIFHSNGTALLAQATATSIYDTTHTVYTCTNAQGVTRLSRGQYVNVYNTAFGATDLKSANTLYIDSIDYDAKTIRLSGIVPSVVATDKICFEGVTGATPEGLKGLYYWNDYSTSGTTLGIDRAAEPEIIANSVSAAGGLTHEEGMLLYHKILMRAGQFADGLIGLCGTNVQAEVYSQVLSVQMYDVGRTQAFVDRMPEFKGKRFFNFANIPHYIDINQAQDRIDWIVPKTWGIAQLAPMDFFQLPGSNQRFFHLTGGSGAPAAGVWFGLIVAQDYYNTEPRSAGVIYAIPLRTGY
jgi:hypothetical protein